MPTAGFHRINPSSVDAAVAQQIGQPYNILFNAVKGACKQMPQIVGGTPSAALLLPAELLQLLLANAAHTQ